MKSGISGVVALMMLASVSPASSWTCSRQCSCGRGPGYGFAECPSNNPNMVIYNIFGKYIQVTCNKATADMKILESFVMGSVPRVIFKQCPLPHTNYSTLLESMGVEDVSQLDIYDKALPATALRDRLFDLNNVTSLSLNSLELTDIPEDFLQNVPQITKLDLRHNKLQIPLGLFDRVPNLQRLELSLNNLTFLEAGTFRNLSQLYRLCAWTNKLQNIRRDTFIGLSQLKALDLNSNGIQELADDVFAELHSLKLLALDANNFTQLPSNLFRNTRMLEMVRINDNRRALASLPPRFLANLPYLREAYLHRMSLSEVPEDLFHGSQNLINITLFGNNLKTLPAGLFRDTIHLLKLDLSWNKLEHLQDNLFSRLTELQVLDISHNKLAQITKYLFGNMYNLQSLILKHNVISDVHEMAFFSLEKLRKFDISSNMVSFSSTMGNSSPLTNCKNLEYLYLSNNSIQIIHDDWRNLMGKLKTIDLSHNKLASIEVQDLIFISHRVELDMTYNNISNVNVLGAEAIAAVSTSSYAGETKHVKAHLQGNPLHCDCSVYSFVQYLESKTAPGVHTMFELVPGNMACASPPMYEGTRVSSLLSERFLCGCDDTKLQEYMRCPSNCTCCAKPYSKELIVDCSNAGLARSPEELPNVELLGLWHTQLLLQGNLITSLPNATQPGYGNVTIIDISHNRLNTLDICQLPPRLQTLYLDHNNLTQLDKPVLNFLENRTKVSLRGNRWKCGCENRDLLSFLQSQFEQVLDLGEIECTTQNNSSVSLSRMTADEICPTDMVLIVICGLAIGVSGVVLGAAATLLCCFRHRVTAWLRARKLPWWVPEDDADEYKLYDAFVSFSHRDEDFVIKELVQRLESEPTPFKLCLQCRDCSSGEPIPLQIARSIEESERTLLVLSPNFLETVWGRMESRAAHQKALHEGRVKVIPVLYGDIDPVEDLDTELKTYLSASNYVKWGEPRFWDKLRCALPRISPTKKTTHYPLNAAVASDISDKMDLIVPNFISPTTTTPPADVSSPLFIV